MRETRLSHFFGLTTDDGNEEREEILRNNKNEGAVSTLKSIRTAMHELAVHTNRDSIFHLYCP